METKSQEDKDFEESLRRREMVDDVFFELLDMATKNDSFHYFVELLLTESIKSNRSLMEVIQDVIKRSPAEVQISLECVMNVFRTPWANANKKELLKIKDSFLIKLLERKKL